MDTIKKVLHPNRESPPQKDNHPPTSEQQPPPGTRPDHETLPDSLGSEPNATGTTAAAGDQPKINRGQHQPRQPVGAAGSSGPDATALDARARAEADNNFPGTNPHPSHSA
ncbi:hypothetical protein KVR01_006234 [Diaporthe batatas]|uniref:uncharacterized protein n=1 Tax=Diaporthe batatas TaxID=748121 RepID=UPI001D05B351|nr:uncharacterized protein KVR01_006234 [Diaporthe batatas]KAG8164316.1 hypothetical protein KVR01_006234 [Diaporthe batatas]